jgi:hypothetical protein
MLALSGCSSSHEATQIFLTVDSDLVVSDDASRREIDAVLVRVHRRVEHAIARGLDEGRGDVPAALEPGERVQIDDYVYESRWSNTFALGARALPIEIGVAPAGGDSSPIAYFEAFALLEGRIVTRVAVRTRFAQGRSVRLVLWLSASCVDVECAPETMCRDGSCVTVEVDPSCLPGASADAGTGPTRCEADASVPLSDGSVPVGCDPACEGGEACVDGACVDPSEDADDGGVPAGEDCDDMDASVGTSASRSCSSACGAGSEVCTSGVWAACDAPATCSCADGETRTRSCGNCGSRPQVCMGDAWMDSGPCAGEGCAPGSVENQSQPCTCGTETRSRTCDASCNWGPWSGWSCSGGGECSPGQVDTMNQACGNCGLGTQSQSRTCGGDCRWGGWSGWGSCSGEECAPGTCECGTCGVGFWRCCNPSTCTWNSCGPEPTCV